MIRRGEKYDILRRETCCKKPVRERLCCVSGAMSMRGIDFHELF